MAMSGIYLKYMDFNAEDLNLHHIALIAKLK
jgi:hypothetical protein